MTIGLIIDIIILITDGECYENETKFKYKSLQRPC
jgi:hypothetical protein